jgi:hypothetical protein
MVIVEAVEVNDAWSQSMLLEYGGQREDANRGHLR